MEQTLKEQIDEALKRGVDLPDEEYAEQFKKADAATAGHGMTKKAPISEARRHKRIEMNYFGLSINYLACMLSAIDQTNQLLAQQNAMLYEMCKKEQINVDELFKRTE